MPMITIVIPKLIEIHKLGMSELDELSVEAIRFEIHDSGHVTVTGEFWVSSDDLPGIMDRLRDEVNGAVKVYRDA